MAEHQTRPQVCKFFRKTGRCDYGKRCRFSHDLSLNKSPDDPLYGRLRTWKFNIPRKNQLVTPLSSTRLQEFFDSAFDLVNSGETGVVQQVIESIASNGGLARVEQAITTVATPSSDQQCLRNGENLLLPLVNILSHHHVTQSFVLEYFMGIILNFVFGIGGVRAVAFFSAAARFLSLSAASSGEISAAVVSVLTCLHNIIELNSSARVVEEFHAIVKDLGDLLEDDLHESHKARYMLQRIEDRLKEGNAMPTAYPTRITSTVHAPFASLDLDRDQPGLLSPKGVRHDNDHEDVKLIQILPTGSEVQSERAEYLPVKDPRNLHLGGAEGLIDRQFRLLREDSIGQLRDIVRAEIDALRDPSSSKSLPGKAQQNLRRFAYKGIKLTQITFDRLGGLRAQLSFNQPKAVFEKSEPMRRQWWEHSRRVCPDALLCLVDASPNVIFFSVCTESAGNRLDTNNNCSKLLYQDARRAIVIVRLIEPYELDIEHLVKSLSFPTSGGHVLCEFPGVLLPSFYPTLKALQNMIATLDLPFAEVLAPSDTHLVPSNLEPPTYAQKPGFKFNLNSIVRGEHLELSVTDTFDYGALAANSSLDDAQQTAVIDALTRKLALIQGPPGTGKSFTGVALIKILLENAPKANLGPIVCICYTNHALDQLLEHLVKDGVEGIIRVGSRSKSELVKRYNLRDAVQAAERTPMERRRFGTNKSNIEKEADAMKPLLETLWKPIALRAVRKFLQRSCPTQYWQLYPRKHDHDGFQVVENDKRDPMIKWLYPRATHQSEIEAESAVTNRSLEELREAALWTMSLQERQTLHNHWKETIKNSALAELSSIFLIIGDQVKELEQCRKEDDLRVLTKAKVIGVTTSGLARNLDVLRRVQSKVLVCEEAGEVLEAHLLTALLPSVEHAVLIGDHEQLKPQIANYELSSENSRGVQYSLDTSMFERLLHPSGSQATPLPYSTLKTQRRMHPSIACLIRKTLYPALIDHPSVNEYPEIEGIRNRLFWLDHDHPESTTDGQDSTSHTNDFEVGMVAALVHHLVRQSRYSSEDIAVLTPYLGQLHKLRNKLASSFEIVVGDRDQVDLDNEGLKPNLETIAQASIAKKTSLSKAVRIATVDNFQGEEAKVVIISLVRSNQERKCGFLKTTNRINVLLSRAQHGMYVLGDPTTYRYVEMWRQVIEMLEENDAIGKSLALHCPRHPNTPIDVATPDDLAIKAPEGGCDLMCDWRLPCGHKCINKCHNKILHQEVLCREPCPRSLTGCDHACSMPCGATCGPCKEQLHDIELPCGHVEASLDCYLAQDPKRVSCQKTVPVKFPVCGHLVERKCWEPDPGPHDQCQAACGDLLPCGHKCESKCYHCKPRENGRILRIDHRSCKKTCERPFNTCSHHCRKFCHAGSPCELCTSPCAVRCAHSSCPKLCSEPCAPCAESCTWECPHTGRCDLPCAVPRNKLPCSKRCESILECGHRCPSVCGEICPSIDFCQICCSDKVRDTMVNYLLYSTFGETNLDEDPCLVPDCGHLMTMSSMDGNFALADHYVMNEEGEILALRGSSDPFSAEGSKTCPICRGSLRSINRYSRIIRRNAIDEATKNFIAWSNMEIIKHANMLHDIQQQFRDEDTIGQDHGNSSGVRGLEQKTQTDSLQVTGHRNKVLADIRRIESLKPRHEKAFQARKRLNKFLYQVEDQEQPFGRLWDLLQDRRRRNQTGSASDDIASLPNVLQSRAYLMSMSLSIKLDVTIIADALAIRKKSTGLTQRYSWAALHLEVDFSQLREECMTLADLFASRQQHRLEIETKVSFAHLTALERSIIAGALHIDRSNHLRELGLEQLKQARHIHKQYPDQTTGVIEELDAVEAMLKDGTFYNVVTSEEKRAVYAAMSQHFSGTGHWYNCANGHPFTVGECGMPMQEARCPQCGSPIGGLHHQPAEGVRSIDEVEMRMGNLDLGRT